MLKCLKGLCYMEINREAQRLRSSPDQSGWVSCLSFPEEEQVDSFKIAVGPSPALHGGTTASLRSWLVHLHPWG